MDKRAAFVLDTKGIVRYAKLYEPGTIPESKEMLDEVLEKIGEHPTWSRAEILKYLKESRALVDRVRSTIVEAQRRQLEEISAGDGALCLAGRRPRSGRSH